LYNNYLESLGNSGSLRCHSFVKASRYQSYEGHAKRFRSILLFCFGFIVLEGACAGVERYPEGRRSGDNGSGDNGGDGYGGG
jgi:hypothetical protein